MRIGTRKLQLPLAWCLLVANGLLPPLVHAETHVAAAVTPEAVWEAINAARTATPCNSPPARATGPRGGTPAAGPR